MTTIARSTARSSSSSCRTTNATNHGNRIVPLLCGIFIGMASMWTYCVLFYTPADESSLSSLAAAVIAAPDGTATSNAATTGTSGTRIQGATDEYQHEDHGAFAAGWHAVHVFYGEPLKTTETHFAQVHQDEAILDLIGNSGYFVDLAANDAQEFSNTLALEKAGWDGLCIEPNPTYWYGLSHRKCKVAGALVGATKQEVDVKFRGVYGGIVGKLDERLANRKREPNAPVEKRYTAPLEQVLQKFQVPPVIDYLSLDVEGAEYLIMKDFPFDQYSIRVMTVERPNKELRQLLEGNGFVFLKDLAWWGETLWAHKSMELSPTHPKVVKIKTEERN